MESANETFVPLAAERRGALWTLMAILALTLVLIGLSLMLQGNFGRVFLSPGRWLDSLDPSVAFDIVSTAAELLAAVLAIAITVVAIVVELAANRYSHRITSLFIREPINIGVMSFFVLATIYSVWIALTMQVPSEGAILTHAGLLSSMLMVTVSFAVLLPYFAFVASFLSPVNFILKIQDSALKAIRNANAGNVEISKQQFLNAVDELQDITRRSVELSDRAVEMSSVNAMLNLTLAYQGLVGPTKANLGEWFRVQGVVQSDPDFVSISSVSLELIDDQKLWAEVKILRQYLDLISDSNPNTRDTSYLIAINTRKIAVESLDYRPDLELLDLCIRCFNSYLRATINNKDARTCYYVMNQYRLLAEEMLTWGQHGAVREIARNLQFYGLLGFRQDFPFLLEVAAEDVAQLAAECIAENTELLQELLGLLLALDEEVKEEFQEQSLLGVRRAQIKLATRLMASGQDSCARQIFDDLKDEKLDRIDRLIGLLETEDNKEYWEFTDRGINFAYLEPALRPHLRTLSEQLHVSRDR